MRQHPHKPQNNYGGDYACPQYDTYSDGKEFCHDEHTAGWNEFVQWATTENGKIKCCGNRHMCGKLRLKWLASLSDKERERYEKRSA